MKKITHLMILFLPLLSCNSKDNNSADNNNSNGNHQNVANEQRMAEFYQKVINAHDPSMIDSFCTADFVDHQPFAGYKGDLAGMKQGFKDMMTGFPDMNCTLETVKSWGDTIMAMYRMKGTNSGLFMGTPASGKSIDVEGVDIVIIRDGKAREHWGFNEEMKMMGQLGMGSQQAEKEPEEKGNN